MLGFSSLLPRTTSSWDKEMFHSPESSRMRRNHSRNNPDWQDVYGCVVIRLTLTIFAFWLLYLWCLWLYSLLKLICLIWFIQLMHCILCFWDKKRFRTAVLEDIRSEYYLWFRYFCSFWTNFIRKRYYRISKA